MPPSLPGQRVPLLLLYDGLGRKALELRPGANDMRHLAPGVYFVRMADGEGRPADTRVLLLR